MVAKVEPPGQGGRGAVGGVPQDFGAAADTPAGIAGGGLVAEAGTIASGNGFDVLSNVVSSASMLNARWGLGHYGGHSAG